MKLTRIGMIGIIGALTVYGCGGGSGSGGPSGSGGADTGGSDSGGTSSGGSDTGGSDTGGSATGGSTGGGDTGGADMGGSGGLGGADTGGNGGLGGDGGQGGGGGDPENIEEACAWMCDHFETMDCADFDREHCEVGYCLDYAEWSEEEECTSEWFEHVLCLGNSSASELQCLPEGRVEPTAESDCQGTFDIWADCVDF